MAENDTGFVTGGYINKKGTKEPGNVLPPGYDIDNQPNADTSVDMPLKRITPSGYPGSGQG